jgi:hypothetical protein
MDANNTMFFWLSTTGTYANGWVTASGNSGSTWIDMSSKNWDANFEEWGY